MRRETAAAAWLAAAILVAGILAAPAAAVDFATFQAPHGYFELPVPKGWHFLSFDHLAERQYLFTSEAVTLEQLQQGVDLDACFAVRILGLESRHALTPLGDLLEEDLDHRIATYREHGRKLEGRATGPQTLAGLEGTAAFLWQDDDDEHLFLGRKGHLLYEIGYSYKREKKDSYLPILQEMAAGLALLEPEPSVKTGVFRDSTGSFSVELPDEWYPMSEGDQDTHFFVSRERVMASTDAFTVGASFRKVPRLSERLPKYRLTSDREIVEFWAGVVLQEQKGFSQKVLDIRGASIGDKGGVVIERSFHFGSAPYYVQELHLILAKNDTLYEVILEAPVMEFELYRPAFNRAIETLELR